MKKTRYFSMLILFFCSILLLGNLQAQVVTTDPVFPTASDDVTIYFNAAEGTGGLAGYTGTVYAHTGVITSESTSPGDWKYVQTTWGIADPNGEMTALGNDLYSISFNINDYYGVPAGETIEQMAFVFRNANGSLEGKGEDGGDIFVEVYQPGAGLVASFVTPTEASFIVQEGEVISVEGAASEVAELAITDNGAVVATATGTSITHEITATETGNHTVEFTATADNITATTSFQYVVATPTVEENPPAGTELGVNKINDTSIRLALYAPNKLQAYVLGSFNDFSVDAAYQMKRSLDGTTFWLDIEGLDGNEIYSYRYLVDGTLSIPDPYTTTVLDPSNDQFIPAVTYPDLPPYPAGQTGLLSTFQINEPVYDWQNTDFENPPIEELVVYELLVRDFIQRHDYQTLIDTLDYLERLGVNAIELMPINEFEGNISWGYNPSFHYAVDKYYGSANDLKAFIDAAHGRGMAVILDVVFNHAFSQSPLCQLYWDAANFRPSPDNPWLNPTPRHDFNVGYDFNHESEATKYYVKRTIREFLEDFRFDGFRFDLSKGLTQVNTLGNVNQWGQYDASRVTILKDYADEMWSINPDAYAIMEHFAVNAEERDLANYGMIIWNNMNHEYNEATMGYGSNLTGTDYQPRGYEMPHLMTYMESHDEERLMFKNLEFGNASGDYDVKDISTALDRVELASCFFYTIPGPKMLWQFGEVGYDFPINYCPNGTINPNCRVDPKPIRWDYYEDADRRDLYNITSELIHLKTTYDVFNTTDYNYSLGGNTKRINLNGDDMDVTVLGNFNVQIGTITPNFQSAGTWYEFFTGDSLVVTDVNAPIGLQPGEYRLYTTERLERFTDVTVSTQDILAAEIDLAVFPNPSATELHIRYVLDEAAAVNIQVFDILGSQVAQVFDGQQPAGAHRMDWTHALHSGLYLVHIQVDGQTTTQKLMVR